MPVYIRPAAFRINRMILLAN